MKPRSSAFIVRWCHWLVIIVPGAPPVAGALGFLNGGAIAAAQAAVLTWATVATLSLWIAWLGQRVRQRNERRAKLEGALSEVERLAGELRPTPSEAEEEREVAA
jgi:hypothetical protein